jgi:hypothetical protein
MHDIERRAFVRGAAVGALAFSLNGLEILLTPRAARAQGVPLRTLSAAQAETLEAVGETLVPGARQVVRPSGRSIAQARCATTGSGLRS